MTGLTLPEVTTAMAVGLFICPEWIDLDPNGASSRWLDRRMRLIFSEGRQARLIARPGRCMCMVGCAAICP